MFCPSRLRPWSPAASQTERGPRHKQPIGIQVYYISRNSKQKNVDNVDVADAACCGELCLASVSCKALLPTPQDFFKKIGVMCAVLLLGSLAHVVFGQDKADNALKL